MNDLIVQLTSASFDILPLGRCVICHDMLTDTEKPHIDEDSESAAEVDEEDGTDSDDDEDEVRNASLMSRF
jgi:hypothetical protein